MDEIGKAILAHSRWKQYLRRAIDNRDSEFSVENVQNCHICAFGKWLDSKDRKSLQDYDEIYELHKKFHIEAAKILNLALNNQSNEAEALLYFGSDFNQVSAKLVNKLGELKNK